MPCGPEEEGSWYHRRKDWPHTQQSKSGTLCGKARTGLGSCVLRQFDKENSLG